MRSRKNLFATAVWLMAMAWSGARGAGEPLLVAHTARALQPGEAVLLTVTSPGALTRVDAIAFGHPVAFYQGDGPAEWHALVGIDLDAPPGVARITVAARTLEGATLEAVHAITVAARVFPTRRLTVDPRFVTPPPSAGPRIASEQKRLAALLASVTPQRVWAGPFAQPVDGAPVSNFGARSVYNGTRVSSHRGVDFASPIGAPIRAPNAGRVVLAEDLYFSGNTVVLDHGLGAFSLLAHMSRLGVRAGDTVARGDVVGEVGATGRVTGPHLHWTFRLGPAAVDPMSILAVTFTVVAPPAGDAGSPARRTTGAPLGRR
jgi:murein DD-endopeptidase MepM/ murein hydrolase activator NlpD